MVEKAEIPADSAALVDMIEFAKKDSSKIGQVLSHIAGLSGTADGISLLIKNINKVITLLASSYQLSSSTKGIIAIKISICSTLANLLACEAGKTELDQISGIFLVLSKESSMKRIMKDALKEAEEEERVLRLRTVIMLGNASAMSLEVCRSVLSFANKPGHEHLNVLERMYNLSLDVSELGTAFLSVVSNLTQVAEFRTWIMSPKKNGSDIRLKSLLPYAAFSPNARRREAVIAAVKNCCFTSDFHAQLVNTDNVNILPALLLPLADGSVKYTEEETKDLLMELRYLDADKKREPIPEIRLCIVEAFYQLCSTKIGREALRKSGTYLILREYHRWEEKEGKNAAINERLFDVIEIIISDEHADSKFDDLHKVEIPKDLKEKFEQESKEIPSGNE